MITLQSMDESEHRKNIVSASWYTFCIPTKSYDMFFLGRYYATCPQTPFPTMIFSVIETCTFEKQLCPVIHGVATAVVILIFTVERFQQTKHRKITFFFP